MSRFSRRCLAGVLAVAPLFLGATEMPAPTIEIEREVPKITKWTKSPGAVGVRKITDWTKPGVRGFCASVQKLHSSTKKDPRTERARERRLRFTQGQHYVEDASLPLLERFQRARDWRERTVPHPIKRTSFERPVEELEAAQLARDQRKGSYSLPVKRVTFEEALQDLEVINGKRPRCRKPRKVSKTNLEFSFRSKQTPSEK
jgi:hypothetical protein